jgi:hypothetical protein
VVRKHSIPPAMWKQTTSGIALFLVVNLVFGLLVPAISLSAHLGGLVFGFLLGAAMLARTEPRTRPTPGRVAGAAIAGAAIVVGVLAILPRPEFKGLPTFGIPDELVAFELNEFAVDKAWQDLQKKHDAKRIDDGQAITRLEADVVAPWRKLCEPIVNHPEPTELIQLKADYCEVKLGAWAMLDAAWRASDPKQREDFLLQYRLNERDARELAAKFHVEYQRRLDMR